VGLVGYFPTYTLGTLYAAQFYAGAKKAIPDLEERIAKGDLVALRDWLVENVHRHGRRYAAAELVEKATEMPVSAEHFNRYLRSKFAPLYGLAN
jgi:carboxypeptidase Taq